MADEQSTRVGSAMFGLMAEFESADRLLEATVRASAAGYKRIEAYSPFPIEGLAEAEGFHTRLPLIVLIAGIAGALAGFFMQYWMMAVDYPLNVGGRPLNS